MLRDRNRGLAAATLFLCAAIPAAGAAPGRSFQGTFANDSDQKEFFFQLNSAVPVAIRTYSYAGGTNQAGTVIPAGGFDPTLSLYDSSGLLLISNQDGGCGTVAADPVTSSCWDAYISTALPAGNYRVVLTQSTNTPAGPTLADSFVFNPGNLFNSDNLAGNVPAPPFGGQANFTEAPGGQSGGFWDFFPSQRTANWAVDILGVTGLAPVISTSGTLPFGISGSAYNPVSLMVQSGTGVSYSWIPPVSGLPAGLSFSASGVLTGTPTASGTYMFTVVATDGVQSVQQTETVAIYSPLLITTAVLPHGVKGQTYGPVQLAVSGGSGSVTWTATALTGGLSLSSGGSLSGTPSASVALFTAIATDVVTGQVATENYSVTVTASPLLISGGMLLSEVAVGTQVSAGFSATGGTPPYSFSSNNLPPGLTIGAGTGTVTGTPTNPGNYSFTVSVSDTGGQSGLATASISVLGFTSAAPPAASTSSPYSFSFSAGGGTGAYSYSAFNQPSGLALSAAGVLSGTPTSTGTFMFTVSVNDGVITASLPVKLSVTAPRPLAVPGGPLSGGQVSAPYSSAVSAIGGANPYNWVLLGGMLPPGLSFASNGNITGTPTSTGSFSFTVQATDHANAVVSGAFSILIAPAPLVLTSGNSLPNGAVGTAYPQQILTAAGGLTPYVFSISSGSLPAGLTLASGQIGGTPTTAGSSSFMLLVTDSAGQTSRVSLSILVSPAQTDLILSDTYLSFSLMPGQVALPATDNVTVRSTVVQQILNYSYTMSPPVPWLAVSGGTITPGSLAISLTNAALSLAGATTPYQTSVSVMCVAPSPCAGHTQNISISVSVTAPSPQLTVAPTLLQFSSTTDSTASSTMPLGIGNGGGGSLGITSITAADSWLTISGAPGSVPAGPPVWVNITANPAGLPRGYNRSSVTVNSSAGSQTTPVTLYISPSTYMTLSPAAGQFSMPAGSPPGPAGGSFQVTVNATQAVNWNAVVAPGASWLSTSTPSGQSTSSAAGTVSYSIDPAAASELTQGTYYGSIAVTSGSATNSPLNYQVILTVGPPASLPLPFPSPSGLFFRTGALGPFTVNLYASSMGAVPYQASASTSDGANWLSVSPAMGAASATTPGASTVSVDTSSLAPGVYSGLVSYALSSAAVRSVNVTLIVTGSTSSIVAGPAASPLASSCSPRQLVSAQTGLPDNFWQVQGLPVGLKVLVTDNCGNIVPDAQVNVTFSNGDPPLILTAVDTVSGVSAGTWTPQGVSPQVTITSLATSARLASGASGINGAVAPGNAPVLAPDAVLGIYNPLIGGAISPGAILQIYGSNLSAAPVSASNLPLTTALGGTSVSIGGIPAPLYYVSPTQINAQAPFELAPGNQYQVVISSNGALAAPGTVSIVPAEPGIAAFQNGQIVAQHLDWTLVSEASPAKPGTYVTFYLAGMGATDTTVADGTGSPGDTLAHPVVAPVLTLNGVPQTYQFVGLTPGLVGLYQINFLVPSTTGNGDMLLVVWQNGVPSNSVILPVHQ